MVNVLRGIQWRAALACFALVSSLAGWTGCAQAEVAAMVTDAAGGITVQGGTGKGNITILSEIETGTKTQLASGARLVVIYVKSGEEYTMSGPALIEFRAGEPVASSGAAPAKRANPLSRMTASVQIKSIGVTQGAVVMRSARPTLRIKLLNLASTKTLETAPEFRWQAVEPGLKYQFELNDDTGKLLFEIQVEGVALKLPPTVKLQEGKAYEWTVSTRLKDDRRYVSSGDFSIASADLRGRVETVRPAAAAPVSERVAFAAWLEQSELKDEARKYWKAVAVERPDDMRLKELAVE